MVLCFPFGKMQKPHLHGKNGDFCMEITQEVGGGLPLILSTSSALGDLVQRLESGSYVFQACL